MAGRNATINHPLEVGTGLRVPPLAFQEPLLPLDSPAISGQVPVVSHHPMTWHSQRHWIGRASASHGADCIGIADSSRNLGIAASFAARNLAKRFPDLLLESRGTHVEREINDCVLAAKAGQQGLDIAPHGSVVAMQFSGVEFFP